MSIEQPRIMDEDKRGELETAIANIEDIYPANIRGMATVSTWKDGEVIKIRINPEYKLKPNLIDDISILNEDDQSILFEYKGFRYYAFHQESAGDVKK